MLLAVNVAINHEGNANEDARNDSGNEEFEGEQLAMEA